MSILDLSGEKSDSSIEVSKNILATVDGLSGIGDDALKNALTKSSEAVHVWFFKVGSYPYYSLLSEEEKQWAQSYKFSEDRESYIFSHGLLRVLLGYYLDLEPCKVGIERESSGRPFISSGKGSDIRFSVSHSKHVVMIAFSRSRIGVDLERLKGDLDFDGVAASLLAANDLQRYSCLHKLEKLTLFYKMWTARESSYKMMGGKLSDYQIKLGKSSSLEVRIGGRVLKLHFHFFKVFDDYVGALAVHD